MKITFEMIYVYWSLQLKVLGYMFIRIDILHRQYIHSAHLSIEKLVNTLIQASIYANDDQTKKLWEHSLIQCSDLRFHSRLLSTHSSCIFYFPHQNYLNLYLDSTSTLFKSESTQKLNQIVQVDLGLKLSHFIWFLSSGLDSIR